MNVRRWLLVLTCLALSCGTASAADLTKIERTIKKEPAYKTTAPTYCLLVFGEKAETRVWLVRDGDLLYVDRNGNGDLTDDGAPVMRRGSFAAGDITESDGKTTHTGLTIDNAGIQVMVKGKVRQQTFSGIYFGQRGRLVFAPRPQDAPIVHFAGPLTVGILGDNTPAGIEPLVRGGTLDLTAHVGTPGLGKGTFASYAHTGFKKQAQPVAEIELPNPKAPDRPLRVKFVLDGPGEACDFCFDGGGQIPAEAGTGTARLTLSLPGWKEGNVHPTTIELKVVDSKPDSKKR